MNVYIETYGCSNSQAESEIMAGLLEKAGSNIVQSPEIADVIIINSCFVKTPTEQKILFRIKSLSKQFAKKKLIVTGCMPEALPEKIIEVAPEASLISTHHITQIVAAVKKVLKGKRIELLGKKKEVKLCLPRIRRNPVIDIVPIANGCNSFCAYCSTRLAKGDLFSYPKEIILKEIESAVKSGCKEIWLTAQDTGAYGLDAKTNIAELLNSIASISRTFFVRLGMANPKNFLRKGFIRNIIKAYRSEKIYKFLHLPVQSGSNSVLKRMNRNYTVDEYKTIVSEFRQKFPNIQIWTDVIVGFPGETEDDFLETCNLLKEVKPDYTNVSQYGARPGTPASRMKQMPSEIKKQRSRIISELVSKINLEKNKQWKGWSGDILITEKRESGFWMGRNYCYKPIIIKSNENLLGKIVAVRVTNALQTCLIGKLIREK